MLTVDCAVSHAQGRVNEDVVGHTETAAWVIDGATGIGAALLDAPSDAAWLAQRADAHLRRLLADAPMLGTRDLLRAVMAACGDDLGRHAVRVVHSHHELPSAAIALVRSWPGALELATLGDCRIAIGTSGFAELFGAADLAPIEGRTIALAERLLAEQPDLSPAELREALLPQLRENRRLMNVEGGYWVLGIDPAAADHIHRRLIDRAASQPFAIASDGFMRLNELFDAAGPDDLLAIKTEEALAGWVDQLRRLERQPDSVRRHPRVKVHDDASFLRGHYRREG